jgi:hypothetical protein
VADWLRLFFSSGEQPRDGLHQFRAHLLGFGADMIKSAVELLLAWRGCQSGE